MQIIEFDRPPSWSLDASETGDSTKYRPMGRGGGGHGGQKKLGDCNSFTLSCVQGPWGLVPPLIKSINSLLPWSKNLLNQGNMIVLLRNCEFRDSRNRFNAVTKLSQMNAEWKNSSLTKKKKAKPSSSDACCLCYILHFMLILKFQLMILVERTSDLLKIHLGVEVDPQDGKTSCEWEIASFCFDTNPPRIILKLMPFWSMLCYALMNSIRPIRCCHSWTN